MRQTLKQVMLRVLRISRPYTTPYAALCCFCGVLSGAQPPTTLQIVVALLLAPTLSLSMPALNDYAHARADAAAGRARDYPPGLLLGMGLAGVVAGLVTALVGGAGVVAGLLASVVIGGGYALAKRVPGASNLVRGLYTAVLVLGCASMTGWTSATWLLAGMIYLADAGGNVWGDIRDIAGDAQAGTRTLAVVDRVAAMRLAWLLLATSLLPLTVLLAACAGRVVALGVAAGLLLAGVLLLGVYAQQPYRHRWILHLKVAGLVAAGLCLAPSLAVQWVVGGVLILALITLNTFYPWLHSA